MTVDLLPCDSGGLICVTVYTSIFYHRIWPLTSIIAQAPTRNRCIQYNVPSVNVVTNKIYLSVCLANSGICSTS